MHLRFWNDEGRMKALRSVAAPVELNPRRCTQAGTRLVKTNLHVVLSRCSGCENTEWGAPRLLQHRLCKTFSPLGRQQLGKAATCAQRGLPQLGSASLSWVLPSLPFSRWIWRLSRAALWDLGVLGCARSPGLYPKAGNSISIGAIRGLEAQTGKAAQWAEQSTSAEAGFCNKNTHADIKSKWNNLFLAQVGF